MTPSFFTYLIFNLVNNPLVSSILEHLSSIHIMKRI
jgi:hypothetical protein